MMRILVLRVKKFVLIGMLLLASGLVMPDSASLAQSSSFWTPRQRILGINDTADTPYLVADLNRTVHAFHSQTPLTGDPELDIVYSRWSLNSGWTLPVDIILPHSGQLAHVEGASLDSQGVLHLVYYCCDDFNPNIYYSQAPAVLAERSKSWSVPVLIGANADPPHTAALAGDGQQDLFVVYSGGKEGKGMYAVRSQDGGISWSEPVVIFQTYSDLLYPGALRLHLDDNSYLHATWTVNDNRGNGIAIYHARLDIAANIWDDPQTIATVKPNQYEVDWLAITSARDELLVVYNDYQPPRRIMRRSFDQGATWQEPEEAMPPTRGEYGHADFAVDSDGVLHMVLGDRGRGLTLWHTTWENERWGQPEPVVPIAESLLYPLGHPLEFHPSRPRIVISQGNLLLVTWTLDPGHGDNGSWFSYRLLDSPEIPVEPLPIPVGIVQEDVSISTSTPLFDNLTPTAGYVSNTSPALQTNNSPNQALFFSLVPVVLIVGTLIFYRLLSDRAH